MAQRRWCALATVHGQTKQYRVGLPEGDCLFDALFAFCHRFRLRMTQLREVREVTQEEIDLALPADEREGLNWIEEG